MRKKIISILLTLTMVLAMIPMATGVAFAQSYNITISCDENQGYFSQNDEYDDETVNNPSVVQVEKPGLCYYREGADGTVGARRLFIYDSYPNTLFFFAYANPKEGYDFVGWYIGDTKIGTGTTTANVNDNVVAKFVSNTKKASGTVVDEEGNPIEGAEVNFNSDDLGKEYTTTTDADGKWSIDAKMNGTYSLNIKKSGYAIYSENDIAHGETDHDLGSVQLTKLNLTYSTNGNGNTLSYDKTGDTITLTANPASGYQLKDFTITLNPEDGYFYSGVQYNGKSLKFNMPNNSDIDVVGNFAQYIDSAAINIELPNVGDTEFACPTATDDKLYVDPDDVYVYDIDEGEYLYTPIEFVEGGHYMVEFGVYFKDDYVDDYAFKYNKDDDFNAYYDYSHDSYGYDVNLTVNEAAIPIFENDNEAWTEAYETIGKSGFYGYDSSWYGSYLWVIYHFTVTATEPEPQTPSIGYFVYDVAQYNAILTEAQKQQALIDAQQAGTKPAEPTTEPTAEKLTASEAKAFVETMVPTVRTENQARGIKVFVKDSDEVAKFKAAGYKVLYDFYRAESKAVPKADDYKITTVVNKEEPWYLNTAAKKGKKYYYKAVAKVYDANGELVAETELTQGKYGCRTR